MKMTITDNPAGKLKKGSPNPSDRFFRNDFLDFWKNDFPVTIPPINVTEEKDNYRIELAAPGLKRDDFSIEVDGNLVTISSEKESEKKEKKETGGYTRREYNYSSFTRSFTVPDHADTNGIAAKYADGILSISLPKKQEAVKSSSRKIKVS
jgi:HSP20 family protein